MIKVESVNQKIRYFLLGAIVVVGAIFLMGASPERQPLVDNGRYQISAWGEGKAFGVFIVDSVTGNTKIAYHYRQLDNGKFQEKNNLNKSFSRMD